MYSKNSLLLLEDSNPESALLRKFLNLPVESPTNATTKDGLALEHSYAFASKITKGAAKDSLLCQVTAKEVATEGAIVVNCVAPKITAGKGCILYNLLSTKEIVATDGQVMVAVTPSSSEKEEDSTFTLKSRMDIDGGKAWKQVVEGNELTFEQVFKNNKQAEITKIAAGRATKYRKLDAGL